MSKSSSIMWFRQDLRILDNPALRLACEHDAVYPIYILDDESAKEHAMGAASRWWLHHALCALNDAVGGKLSVYCGSAVAILAELSQRLSVQAVYWNRGYEPWRIERDKRIKQHLVDQDIDVQSCNGSLLWEPWQIKKQDGGNYKVFTPFYRKGCLNAEPPRQPLPEPHSTPYQHDSESRLQIDDLALRPTLPWDASLAPHWDISEEGAHQRLEAFINEGLAHYRDGRNLPAKPYVSRLSPYLHFGQLSPNQVWYALRSQGDDHNVDHFCSELGWREFSYSLLFHYPDLPRTNLQAKFDAFPWGDQLEHLQAWQKGQTGIPMVDAGMRELWQTGFMHNRVRMIVGSFLVKNLRLHWHHGERWFWDTLVDADLANNSASWQWIAGCGADAAPYFRIFNPVTQGQKFDPDGEYVRQYVPELAGLPNKYVFSPWEAPESVLRAAKVTLGKTYPAPIVDLKASRQRALDAFASLKKDEE